MSEAPPSDDVRLVRILAPSALLREVDSLVRQKRGGYESRQEFFLDAVENQILEVKYGAVSANGQRQLPVDGESDAATPASPQDGDGDAPTDRTDGPPDPAALSEGGPVSVLSDFAQTELRWAGGGSALDEGLAAAADEPLFGLHNRDYPSLWVALRLAEKTQTGPVELKAFVDETLIEAWRFAASLEALDGQASTKLTALFPKNRAKPQSAEENFRAFAIGTLAKKAQADGRFKASGPLFTWGLAQVRRNGEALEIGLTSAGYALLEELDGLSLRLPHEKHFAERFLEFLRAHAPADAGGFEHLLTVAPEGLNRTELAGRFNEWQPRWSATEANTYAAAYVARAREWGLLEEKLVDRQYVLTPFGETQRGARVPA